jgi:hypothetical protein
MRRGDGKVRRGFTHKNSNGVLILCAGYAGCGGLSAGLFQLCFGLQQGGRVCRACIILVFGDLVRAFIKRHVFGQQVIQAVLIPQVEISRGQLCLIRQACIGKVCGCGLCFCNLSLNLPPDLAP